MTDETAAGSATPATDATPAPAAVEATTTETPAPEAVAAEATTEGAKPEAEKTADEKASEAAKVLAERKNAKREESQRRWNEREQARAAAERRAERAEARVRELEAKQAPDPSKYDDVTRLNADQVAHTLDQREADNLKSEAKTAREEADREVAIAWQERSEAFKADVPDFEEVAYKAPLDETSAALIARMEEGPALAYHLGKNPSEARRLSTLSERDKAIELGRLAGRLNQTPPRRTSTAPTPVTAIAGKGASASNPDPRTLPMDDYAAKRKAGWKG